MLSTAVVTVRAAGPNDAGFVRELAAEAFAEYDSFAARTAAGLMREPRARTWIAERAERRLGFVIVRTLGDALALNAIAVARSERGRGVGRLLLRAAERQARGHGLRTLVLNTAQANLAALDLFLRAGFVISDRSALRYRGGQPACRLEKRLE